MPGTRGWRWASCCWQGSQGLLARSPWGSRTPACHRVVKRALATTATPTSPDSSSPITPSALRPPEQPIHHLPRGFLAGALSTGVKRGGARDLTLIVSPAHPCVATATYTQNPFCAAPVTLSKGRTDAAMEGTTVTEREGDGPRFHAVLVNSGCANACTGQQGLADARELMSLVDAALGSGRPVTLMASTGVIGQPLAMPKLRLGLSQLLADVSESRSTARMGRTTAHWQAAAQGIMTTDTYPKLVSEAIQPLDPEESGPAYSLAGWSKGAGMIHPNMATMLGGIFTDANITQSCLQAALAHVVPRTFNAISVDGDTSTNDTLFLLANGASPGSPYIREVGSPAFLQFRDALERVALRLAHMIVRDGEGATKFVEIEVKGAASWEQAKTTAERIATSPLVKTAIFGRDANWGRIICAVGNSATPPSHPERVSLMLSAPQAKEKVGEADDTSHQLHLFCDGAPHDTNEEVAARILEQPEIRLVVDLGEEGGKGASSSGHSARMWTCDLSHEYVRINGDYRS